MFNQKKAGVAIPMGQNRVWIKDCYTRERRSLCACQVTLVLSDSVTQWAAAHQAPLSMEFSRQEYGSGLPHPPPGDLPKPGMEPLFLSSPALVAGFFTPSATWEAQRRWLYNGKRICSTGWWNNDLCTHSILGCVSKKSKNITSERYMHFNGRSSIIYFFGSLTFFKINSFFKWRIIALQKFVVFCQTSTRISHKYTYTPPCWTSLPFPSRPTPLGW